MLCKDSIKFSVSIFVEQLETSQQEFAVVVLISEKSWYKIPDEMLTAFI